MENLDESLLIAKIEVSCWKEQLKQAVSSSSQLTLHMYISSISNLKLGISFHQSYFFIFFLFQGFTETTLMPLQASTILLRADQRRAAVDPPLPPISHYQVQHGELVSLLTEEDYNLSTMVNL